MKRLGTSFLVLIIFLSFGARLYKLDTLPQILNRDEAGLAYNALLLKETGRDEWGKSWPITLESFGDYKLPGYPVLLVALFSVLGTSDAVVRLPSLLAGISLIILAYSIAKQSKWGEPYSLMLAVVVATTPVFFFYSRIAFEAMVGLALLLNALLLLFGKPFGKFTRTTQDILGIFLWLFAAITYNTPLLLIPFFLPVVVLSRGIESYKKWLLPIFALSTIFIGLFFSQVTLTSQKSGITLFNDETTREAADLWYGSFSGANQKLFGNKYFYYSTLMFKNTVATFSPSFLMSRGGSHPLHQLPGSGHVLVTVYLFGILGLILALVTCIKRMQKTLKWKKIIAYCSFELLLLYTTVISLAPSIVTVDAPHATRSLLFFFCLSVASVYALKQLKGNIGTLFIVVSILLFSQYLTKYFTEYPRSQPDILHVGFDTVIRDVESTTIGPVAVVDGDGFQYILTAWYLQTPPDLFFTTIVKQLPNSYGFKYGQQLDRYHFIGQSTDRTDSEKTVVEWKAGSWQVETF